MCAHADAPAGALLPAWAWLLWPGMALSVIYWAQRVHAVEWSEVDGLQVADKPQVTDGFA